MKTYLILKEKTEQWNAAAEINADDGSTAAYTGAHFAEKAGHCGIS